MKKILVITTMVIILGGIFLLLFKKPPAITNFPPKEGIIIAFGDSLVEGVGATEGNAFPAKLGKLVGEPILNMGHAGDTTEDGLRRLTEVLSENPRIVLLLLGGNDFLGKIPAEQTFINLDKIIARLQESGVLVILLGVRGGFLTDQYDQRYEELAKKRGALYVPNVLKGLLSHDEFMSDSIHPNDAGYKKIAEKIYPVLQKALGK
ncbi:MAG: GDSL-type esterase/lipase family protein [Patescibacteria group bacterium]